MIDLTEEFSDASGQLVGYDSYQAADRAAIATLKHRNLRSFRQGDVQAVQSVFLLSSQTVGALDNSPVGTLSSPMDIGRGEKWTKGGVDTVVADQYVPSLVLPLLGTTLVTASSVIAEQYDAIQSPSWVNLVVNPGAEVGVNTWATTVIANNHITAAGATLTRTESAARSGRYVFNLNLTAVNQGASINLPGTFKSGVTYQFRMHVRLVSGTAAAMALTLGNGSSGDRFSTAFTPNGTGSVITGSWTPSADRSSVFLALRQTGATAQVLEFDQVFAGKGTSQPTLTTTSPTADGDSVGWRWTGTPNASTSVGPYNYTVETVDALTGFEDDDHIVLSVANYSTTIVDATQSSLVLTSNPTGSFSGAIATVLFSQSVTAPVNGFCELRFPRSLFVQNGIDLANITGVRINVKPTADGTIRFVGGVRLLSKNWSYGVLDVDTRFDQLRRTVPRNADVSAVPAFNWPILLKADQPSGDEDPRPIDGEFGVIFNTGQISQTNSFTLYFRETTEDFLTQLDLNTITQAALNGHDQPDTGTAMYNSRVQSDLEAFDQVNLDTEHQFELERTPDFLSAGWIQFVCQWGVGTGTMSIVDTEGNGYTLTIPGGLTANTRYVCFATLEENTARAAIYTLDTSDNVGTKVFDSSRIFDDTAYKRRKGRFGWHADLRDGNAYVDSIRTRNLNFAEYRSLPFESITPVVGAELFTTTSPNIQLFSDFAPGPYNLATTALVSRDSSRSTTGLSYKVTNYGNASLQGLQSNLFSLTDFDNSEINFDIYVPQNAASSLLRAFLVDETNVRTVELMMPKINYDQWQTVHLSIPFGQTVLSGNYRLLLVQISPLPTVWWADNISIFSRTVNWEGRAVIDDPWGANDARWTPFKNAFNAESMGVLFPRRGNQLQVRARGLRQNATISRVQFKPKYAELGNIKAAGLTKPSVNPVGGYTSNSLAPRLWRFTSTATDPDGYVANVEWNFGDGDVGIGNVVTHQYVNVGTYTINQVVTDNNGNQTVFTNTLAV